MMAITHAAIAVAGCSLILGTADPLVLSMAIVGSQLPDVDTTTSTIGQIFYPVAAWIEKRYPHRTVTHSFLATGAIALVALPIGYLSSHLLAAAALPLGHLLATFSDCFTKQGVQLFFPYPAWCISVSNPRRRLKTGGAGELWVLGMAIALLVAGIHIATGGGITQQVSQSLGLKDGIIQTYNANAATYQVYANITGVWASDRSSADGRYFILGTEGSEFIVTDGKGLYKTNQQIIVSKLSSVLGEKATTTSKTLTFDDENPVPALRKLQVDYPNAAIYLSGAIAVAVAIVQLADQYVTGTVGVKVISGRS
jgi:inner membrane protein